MPPGTKEQDVQKITSIVEQVKQKLNFHKGCKVQLQICTGSYFPKLDKIDRVIDGSATTLSVNIGQVTLIYVWIYENSAC